MRRLAKGGRRAGGCPEGVARRHSQWAPPHFRAGVLLVGLRGQRLRQPLSFHAVLFFFSPCGAAPPVAPKGGRAGGPWRSQLDRDINLNGTGKMQDDIDFYSCINMKIDMLGFIFICMSIHMCTKARFRSLSAMGLHDEHVFIRNFLRV